MSLLLLGVLLGYIVYLAVSFFTGELAENAVDLVAFYFPEYEGAVIRLFSLQDSRSQNTASRRNSTSKNPNGRSTSVLFDDDSKQLLVADMGIDDHSPIGFENKTTGADFGTDFRQTLVSRDSTASRDSAGFGAMNFDT